MSKHVRKSGRIRAVPSAGSRSRPYMHHGADLASRFTGLSRLGRILTAAFFALAVTLAVSPVVDSIYLSRFFDESTRMLPSLISTGFGMAMYIAGWMILVNREPGEPAAKRVILWYLGIGISAILVALLWGLGLLI